MNPFDHTEIPESVTRAARYVSAYFLTRGVETWELLDICSRNHAKIDTAELRDYVEAHMANRHRHEHLPALLERIVLAQKEIMVAQQTLDASVAGLTSAVNNAVAALAASSPTTSTPDTVVAAYQAAVDAQTVALATATPPATASTT